VIVVADTSVVLNLCRVQHAQLLQTLCLSLTADALLVDESLGRAVAVRLGLRTIGILGILVEARARSLIPTVAPVLDRLEQEAGFWIAPALRTRVLQLAKE